ncbi:hypothetical protein AgCh_021527 [Apium graveolens]
MNRSKVKRLVGCDIKKGWAVFLDVISIHHDPENLWDPEKFDSSRFDIGTRKAFWLPWIWKRASDMPRNQPCKAGALYICSPSCLQIQIFPAKRMEDVLDHTFEGGCPWRQSSRL